MAASSTLTCGYHAKRGHDRALCWTLQRKLGGKKRSNSLRSKQCVSNAGVHCTRLLLTTTRNEESTEESTVGKQRSSCKNSYIFGAIVDTHSRSIGDGVSSSNAGPCNYPRRSSSYFIQDGGPRTVLQNQNWKRPSLCRSNLKPRDRESHERGYFLPYADDYMYSL